MVAKTQSSVFSDNNNEEQCNRRARGRRVEDELRLRELELQTNFQIKTLSEALNNLKLDFVSWRDSLNDKLEDNRKEVRSLNMRMTIAIALLLGQIAGGPALVSKLLGF